MGLCISRKTSGQTALLGNAGEENPHSIRNRQTEIGQIFSRFGLELLIHPDVQHGSARSHDSALSHNFLFSSMSLN